MSQNDVKLGAVKNSAFLANVSYDSTDKMKTRDFAKVENRVEKIMWKFRSLVWKKNFKIE